ncbi:hypothetical protein Vafri_12696, partial [Volvox africanus]
VLVDLIQHSCKPHPRPPRAGMKTLIVQGRILAEAIAQDALFQLDPVDRAAPRPDRDLVDLINRLRDHHPNSLLAPALHVLRTLGNTAVHLDRDSARLTDGEIGDAAAVCCRFVVLVVDVYMQMCANLHKHEETEAALAQPLLQAPVAPIPPPNVLLRPRDPTPPRPPVPEELPTAMGAAAAAGAAVPSPPPMPSASMAAHALLRVVTRTTLPDDDVRTVMVHGGSATAATAHRDSGGGSSSGGRRSFPGCADGSGRVPYSLVSSDWSVVPHLHIQASSSGGGDGSSGNGGDSGRGRSLMSRCWWPPAISVEASAAPTPPAPPTLLRCPEVSGQSPVSGLASPPPPPQLSPQPLAAAASGANWLQDQYGLLHRSYGSQGTMWAGAAATSTNHFGQRRSSSGVDGVDAGSQSEGVNGFGSAAATPVPAPSQPPFTRMLAQDAHRPLPSQPTTDAAAAALDLGHGITAPYILSGGTLCSAPGPTDAAAAAAMAPQVHADPWVPVESNRLAGSSPRRVPIYLTGGEASGSDQALVMAFLGGSGLAVRGSSPVPGRHGPGQPVLQPLVNHHQQPQDQPPQQQQQQEPQQHERVALDGASTTGREAGPGAGCSVAGLPMGPNEASKRLLQLCAVAQTPVLLKVEKLMQAGATLTYTDKSGMTALHLACYWCHVEVARLLLDRQPSAAAAADREGRTPLWVASQRGHVEIVEMLLALTEGAMQVDIANAAGVTPLRVSAAQGHCKVVAALLRAGANVELADKDGFTPLYVAAARNQLEVVRLLLAAAAPVDRPDKVQRTPLWAALHPGGAARAEASPERRAAVVRALLDRGADVYLLADARDREYCWQVLAQSIAEGG